MSLLLYILTWFVYLNVLSRFSPLLHPPDLASAVQPNTTLFISIASRSEGSYKRGTQWKHNVKLISVGILLVVICLFLKNATFQFTWCICGHVNGFQRASSGWELKCQPSGWPDSPRAWPLPPRFLPLPPPPSPPVVYPFISISETIDPDGLGMDPPSSALPSPSSPSRHPFCMPPPPPTFAPLLVRERDS